MFFYPYLESLNQLDNLYRKANLEHLLKTGESHNPTGERGFFTTLYFHKPDEFEQEIRDAGFEVHKLVGLEGTSYLFHDIETTWDNQEKRNLMMTALKLIESEPSLMGIHPHLLAVTRKPENII